MVRLREGLRARTWTYLYRVVGPMGLVGREGRLRVTATTVWASRETARGVLLEVLEIRGTFTLELEEE